MSRLTDLMDAWLWAQEFRTVGDEHPKLKPHEKPVIARQITAPTICDSCSARIRIFDIDQCRITEDLCMVSRQTCKGSR